MRVRRSGCVYSVWLAFARVLAKFQKDAGCREYQQNTLEFDTLEACFQNRPHINPRLPDRTACWQYSSHIVTCVPLYVTLRDESVVPERITGRTFTLLKFDQRVTR